jgi:hypothetical protein
MWTTNNKHYKLYIFINEFKILKTLKYDIMNQTQNKTEILNNLRIYCYKGELNNVIELVNRENLQKNDFLEYDNRLSLKRSALTNASENGHLDVVSYLIKTGNLQKHDIVNQSILYIICQYGHINVLKYLIEYFKLQKSDLQYKYNFGSTLLYTATTYTRTRNIEIIRYLLTFNLDKEYILYQQILCNRSALMNICSYFHIDLIEYIIDLYDLKKRDFINDKYNMSGLICCFENKNIEIVKFLIEKLKLEKDDITKNNLINYLYSHRYIDVINYLIEKFHLKKEDIMVKDECGNTPLFDMLCCYGSISNIEEKLFHLEKHEILNVDNYGSNIFIKICSLGYLTLITDLIEKYDLKREDIGISELIYIIVAHGHLNVLQYMIKTFKLEKDDILELIMVSCMYGYLEILQFLVTNYQLNRGDIMIKNKDGNTPLTISLKMYGSINIIKYLIEIIGCNIDDVMNKNNDGMSILMLAEKKYNYEILKYLVKYFNLYDYYNIDIIKFIIEDYLNEKNYIKVFEWSKFNIILQNRDISMDMDMECIICLENRCNIMTKCKHKYCIDCFMIYYYTNDNRTCALCRSDLPKEIYVIKDIF